MTTLSKTERTNQLFLLQDKITSFGNSMEQAVNNIGADTLAELLSNLPDGSEVDHTSLGLPDLPDLDIELFADIPFRDAVVYWLAQQDDQLVGKSYITVLLANLRTQPSSTLASAHAGATLGITAFLWSQFDMSLQFCATARKIARECGTELNLAELVIQTVLNIYGSDDEECEQFIAGLKQVFLDYDKDEFWSKYFEIEIPDTPNL